MTRRTLFRSVLGALAGAQAARSLAPHLSQATAEPTYPTLEDNPGQNVDIRGEVFINGKHISEVIADVSKKHGIKPL